MNCGEAEDFLVDLADLTTEQRLRLEAHLRQCNSCQLFREALQDIDSTLASAFPTTPARSLNLGIAAMGSARRPSIIPEFLDVAGMFGVIACAAVLFAALIGSLEPDIPMSFWFGVLLFLSGLGAVFQLSQNSARSNW